MRDRRGRLQSTFLARGGVTHLRSNLNKRGQATRIYFIANCNTTAGGWQDVLAGLTLQSQASVLGLLDWRDISVSSFRAAAGFIARPRAESFKGSEMHRMW